MRLAREGYREIVLATLVLGGLALLAGFGALRVSPWLGAVAAPLAAAWFLAVAFFRDPERRIPNDPGVWVSPADGRITDVTHLESSEGVDGPCLRVGVFLSVFDVHINRSPCAGRVVAAHYRPGAFLDARHPQAGERNEAMTLVLEADELDGRRIAVRQVAGLIARRIICRAREGDRLARGERYGLIKFGSRTELIVPADAVAEVLVTVGVHVRGGATPILRVR